VDKVKIILENGSEVEVYSIFYLYNSKYYFMYTTKEIDSNGYVVLYLVQVGKELKNTPEGPVDTGYMVGVEISDPDEWKLVQESITKIVDDKKNNIQSPGIQYLPISMLSTLKIVSKKTFRLMRNIIENDFNLNIDIDPKVEQNFSNENIYTLNNTQQQIDNLVSVPLASIGQQNMTIENGVSDHNESDNFSDGMMYSTNETAVKIDNSENTSMSSMNNPTQNDVIIDYRSSFFEEQEKNKQLQLEIEELKQKLENIKSIIE